MVFIRFNHDMVALAGFQHAHPLTPPKRKTMKILVGQVETSLCILGQGNIKIKERPDSSRQHPYR